MLKRLLLLFWEPMIPIELHLGDQDYGGLVAELGSGDVFLFLALCNILEDRVMKYGNRQR